MTKIVNASLLAPGEKAPEVAEVVPENMSLPRGVYRKRRLDPVIVKTVADSSIKNKQFRSSRHAVRGLRIGVSSLGRQMEERVMYSYVSESKKHFRGRCLVHIATDAGRLAMGTNRLFSIANAGGKCAWLVPQVFCRGNLRRTAA